MEIEYSFINRQILTKDELDSLLNDGTSDASDDEDIPIAKQLLVCESDWKDPINMIQSCATRCKLPIFLKKKTSPIHRLQSNTGTGQAINCSYDTAPIKLHRIFSQSRRKDLCLIPFLHESHLASNFQ
jgi:hypothetical protein